MKKEVLTPLEILEDRGFKPYSDLPYCNEDGTEYFIGENESRTAGIVALMCSEDHYILDKAHLRLMSETARTAGIKQIILYTNYGLELHSRHEKPSCVNMDKIIKVNSDGSNLAVYNN